MLCLPTLFLAALGLAGFAKLPGAACGTVAQEQDPQSAPTSDVADAPDPSEPSPQERVEALANDIANGLMKGQAHWLDRSVNWIELGKRALQNVELTLQQRSHQLPALVQRLRSRGASSELLDILGSHGSARVVHVHEMAKATSGDNQEWYVLLRLVGDRGFSYVELQIQSDVVDRIAVVDMRRFGNGELWSESIRNRVMLEVSRENAEFRRSSAKSLAVMRRVIQARHALAIGKPAEARLQIEAVPKQERQTRAVLLTRIEVYAHFETALQVRALQDFKQQFPRDRRAGLILFRADQKLGNLDSALATLDRFSKRIGGDAYLELERGRMLMQTQHNEQAYAAFARAHAQEPELEEAVWLGFELALAGGDDQRLLEFLPAVGELLQGDYAWLEQIPAWNLFLSGPTGQRWSQRE